MENSKNNKKEISLFFSDAKIAAFVLITIGLLILVLIWGLIKLIELDFKLDNDRTIKGPGEIGDIIGGFSSPIIGLIAALLTFLAFWIQFTFNKYQTEKIEQQRIAQEIVRFEGLFYEMIRIHRANVSEITIKNVSSSRRAFISMFKEFKFCYYVLIEVYNDRLIKNKIQKIDDKKLVNIAFVTFFFGIGESSEDVVNSLLKGYKIDFRNDYYNTLAYHQSIWNSNKDDIKKGITTQFKKLSIKIDDKNKFELTIGYKPFSGHLGRLGHYFRHLYQTVVFVDNQDPSIIPQEAKYNYIKLLRGQISAHEQLLLYYNSLTVMGVPWWAKKLRDENEEKGLLEYYKLIKNIPLPLANIKPTPLEQLNANLFEWTEIITNLGISKNVSKSVKNSVKKLKK